MIFPFLVSFLSLLSSYIHLELIFKMFRFHVSLHLQLVHVVPTQRVSAKIFSIHHFLIFRATHFLVLNEILFSYKRCYLLMVSAYPRWVLTSHLFILIFCSQSENGHAFRCPDIQDPGASVSARGRLAAHAITRAQPSSQ